MRKLTVGFDMVVSPVEVVKCYGVVGRRFACLLSIPGLSWVFKGFRVGTVNRLSS